MPNIILLSSDLHKAHIITTREGHPEVVPTADCHVLMQRMINVLAKRPTLPVKSFVHVQIIVRRNQKTDGTIPLTQISGYRKFLGCSCVEANCSESCACLLLNRECDPDHCKHDCQNSSIRKGIGKLCAIGEGAFGLGLFAL